MEEHINTTQGAATNSTVIINFIPHDRPVAHLSQVHPPYLCMPACMHHIPVMIVIIAAVAGWLQGGAVTATGEEEERNSGFSGGCVWKYFKYVHRTPQSKSFISVPSDIFVPVPVPRAEFPLSTVTIDR